MKFFKAFKSMVSNVFNRIRYFQNSDEPDFTALRGRYRSISDEDFEGLIVTAIHEAGHALMLLFAGWKCQSIDLVFQQTGRLDFGRTVAGFGSDEDAVLLILNDNIMRPVTNLPYYIDVAFRRAVVAHGGLVAEKGWLYANGKQLDEMGREFRSDHNMLSAFCGFIRDNGSDLNRRDISIRLDSIENQVFEIPIVRLAVRRLAFETIRSRGLTARKIDKVISMNGFKDFLVDNNYRTYFPTTVNIRI